MLRQTNHLLPVQLKTSANQLFAGAQLAEFCAKFASANKSKPATGRPSGSVTLATDRSRPTLARVRKLDELSGRRQEEIAIQLHPVALAQQQQQQKPPVVQLASLEALGRPPPYATSQGDSHLSPADDLSGNLRLLRAADHWPVGHLSAGANKQQQQQLKLHQSKPNNFSLWHVIVGDQINSALLSLPPFGQQLRPSAPNGRPIAAKLTFFSPSLQSRPQATFLIGAPTSSIETRFCLENPNPRESNREKVSNCLH